MENHAKTRTKSRKPPARPELEPISYEEIMANAGMSGFVSFLDAPEPGPLATTSAGTPASSGPESGTVSEVATVEKRPPYKNVN